jgi:hypothetical protein
VAIVRDRPGLCRICDDIYVTEFINVVEFIPLADAM